MTEKEFNEAKHKALMKALPHYLAPDRFGPARLTLDETALLMSPSADALVAKSAVSRLEKSALLKLKDRFASFGVRSLSDLI